MSTLLHISDTHFGTERTEVVTALLKLANQLAPERVVLSGDITQRARRSQFAAARRFVDALPAPTLVIPGNHDIPLFNLWARLRHPYANFRRDFGSELAPSWRSSQWHVFTLNTTRWWRHKDGEVSSRQRASIVRQLREASPDAVRIVVTHQPMRVTRERDESNLLHGHASAADAWVPAGVDLLLGGHIHLPYVVPLRSTSMAAPYVVQAGTAVSHRVRGDVPNSVNVLRRDGLERECVVERWDFDRGTSRFEKADARVLALRDHAPPSTS